MLSKLSDIKYHPVQPFFGRLGTSLDLHLGPIQLFSPSTCIFYLYVQMTNIGSKNLTCPVDTISMKLTSNEPQF